MPSSRLVITYCDQSFPSHWHCLSTASSLSGAIPSCPLSRAFPYPQPGDAGGRRSASANLSHQQTPPVFEYKALYTCPVDFALVHRVQTWLLTGQRLTSIDICQLWSDVGDIESCVTESCIMTSTSYVTIQCTAVIDVNNDIIRASSVNVTVNIPTCTTTTDGIQSIIHSFIHIRVKTSALQLKMKRHRSKVSSQNTL